VANAIQRHKLATRERARYGRRLLPREREAFRAAAWGRALEALEGAVYGAAFLAVLAFLLVFGGALKPLIG
jgi:hypothetical protein